MEYFVEVIVKTNRRNLFIGIADIGLGLILTVVQTQSVHPQ